MPLKFDAAHPRALLPASHWEALTTASAELVDWVLDDLVALAQGTPVADLIIADYLPRAFLHRYDDEFLRDFLVCLVAVGLKLQLPHFSPLGCTGEELAAEFVSNPVEIPSSGDGLRQRARRQVVGARHPRTRRHQGPAASGSRRH